MSNQPRPSMASILGCGHSILNLVRLVKPKIRIHEVVAGMGSKIPIFVHPDDHIDLDSVIMTHADPRICEVDLAIEESDLLMRETSYLIDDLTIITRSYYRELGGGESWVL